MKTLYFIFSFAAPLLMGAQIPVTDAATNASIGITNGQLTSINSHLVDMNAQLKAINQNLVQLVNLLDQNNEYALSSKNTLKEELEAKKNAPDYVFNSPDVDRAVELKDKILEAYRASRNSVQQFKYLDRKEAQEFLNYTSEVVQETRNLFQQCTEILRTRSIIQPEERLKKVNAINLKLSEILDGLIDYNGKLSQINSYRMARTTLINMN